MKCEIDISSIELLKIFLTHMKFFSDLCLDDIKTKIQKELDSREFEGEKMKIITEYIYPPISYRGNDWVAYYEEQAEEGLRGCG